MGKVSWEKDQRQKAKAMQLPLVSIGYDGGTLPKDRDGRFAMTIDGPCPEKFVDKFKLFIQDFCKAMADEEREATKPKRGRPVKSA